jgi:hypothetical protein
MKKAEECPAAKKVVRQAGLARHSGRAVTESTTKGDAQKAGDADRGFATLMSFSQLIIHTS